MCSVRKRKIRDNSKVFSLVTKAFTIGKTALGKKEGQEFDLHILSW
jgi:hypothetical protein